MTAAADYAALADDDDPKLDVSPLSSTPSTASPATTPFLSLAHHAFTPLSMVDDSFSGPLADSLADKGPEPASAPADDARLAHDAVQKVSAAAGAPDATGSAARVKTSDASDAAVAVDSSRRRSNSNFEGHGGRIFRAPLQNSGATAARGQPLQLRPDPVHDITDSAPSPDYDTNSPSPLSDFPPLRAGSVQPDTPIARPKPLIRTALDNDAVAIKHPVPDLNTRSGAYAGNIAQLEATAERLSMTSSIDDAIRDLHGELKRSDSRRSSNLAASVRASDIDDTTAGGVPVVGQLKRHLSTSSSIVSTNIAARHGGYSPAGYVMSPNHSLTGRLRSGSKNSAGRPDLDIEVVSKLSRHGPGKASVRSVRSTKLSLQEISESEPISLTQDALPIEYDDNDDTIRLPEQDHIDVPSTDAFHQMLGETDFMDHGRLSLGLGEPHDEQLQEDERNDRPTSSRSNTTFQQAQDAFGDFDGVHWEPEREESPPLEPMPEFQAPRMVRPQSYIDPASGQHMLYYPARVPAMLNLPPKLSSKPKTAQRNDRRSQVISAMIDTHWRPESEFKKQSRAPNLNRVSKIPDMSRDSWLPDPLAGHRESFAVLVPEDDHVEEEASPARADGEFGTHLDVQAEPSSEQLRRPQRLSRMDPENRKSRMQQLDKLPPQLRASAYFDLPSTSPEVEIKDGSAMATLESILDAAAKAPVSAFTDHAYAGKLGAEIYGKEKKPKSKAPAAALRPVSAGQEPKKRSTFMWLGKRNGSVGSDDRNRPNTANDAAALGAVHGELGDSESQRLSGSVDGDSVIHHDREELGEEDDDESPVEGEDGYQGAPTTLLAELQLRKQQQKQRTQPLSVAFPNGMHATLLEMDAVAEAQRKNRQTKRVNLAWEDPDAHIEEDESEDEDVPLAIIAAKNQGANNMADLERPIGLMERRDLEDNEPLSQRRARLQGLDTRSMFIPKRQSMMTLSGPMMGAEPFDGQSELPELDEAEVPGESLGDRKRRLAAQDEAENPLPRTRPVSTAFSVELLNVLNAGAEDGKEDPPKKSVTPTAEGEEETLGQRRRRLQAEREAREREMSYGNLVGQTDPPLNKRLSLANVLSAHPKKDVNPRVEEERRRMQEDARLAREQELKMTAMRMQMPMALVGPNIQSSGGFRGGAYNDGTGGISAHRAIRSTPAVHTQGLAPGLYDNRASTVFSTYGAPMAPMAHMAPTVPITPISPPAYNTGMNMNKFGGMNPMGGYNGMNPTNPYGGASMHMYGGGMMQPGMQMSMPPPPGSSNRIEQWRQSVQP